MMLQFATAQSSALDEFRSAGTPDLISSAQNRTRDDSRITTESTNVWE